MLECAHAIAAGKALPHKLTRSPRSLANEYAEKFWLKEEGDVANLASPSSLVSEKARAIIT